MKTSLEIVATLFKTIETNYVFLFYTIQKLNNLIYIYSLKKLKNIHLNKCEQS